MDERSVYGIARRTLTTLIVAAMLVALAGCAGNAVKPEPRIETVEVKVPVKVARVPPAELVAANPRPSADLKFVKPSDPSATSALTAKGEKALKLLIADLQTTLEAWRAWATTPDPPAD